MSFDELRAARDLASVREDLERVKRSAAAILRAAVATRQAWTQGGDLTEAMLGLHQAIEAHGNV